jgi:hypothetical protein
LRRYILLAIALGLFGAAGVGLGSTAQAATDCTFTTSGSTMTLDADCSTDATILIPQGVTLDGDGNTITAVEPGVGHFLGAVVKNSGTVAHVRDLRIVAANMANICDPGGVPDNRLRGILFDGASGSITDNVIDGVNQGASGCQEGNGIEVRNAPFDGTGSNPTAVTITGNTVNDYQKTGIVANGNVNVSVTHNELSGLSPVPSIAQNGIQIGFGATGAVRFNTIDGNWFTGANWTSAGVLVFQASGVAVQHNDLVDNQSGITVESWCYLGGPSGADNNLVQHNAISGSDYGVSVAAYVFSSSCDATANNNKVINNTINGTGAPGSTGVFVGTGVFDGSGTTATASGNKVNANKIKGFDVAIDLTGATGSKVHGNHVAP